MKVIYLHQYFSTPSMPGITRAYEMARRLVRCGHEVHVVTTERDGALNRRSGWFETEECGIRIHWCPVPYSNNLPFHDRIRAFSEFACRAAPKVASLRGDVILASSAPLTIALPAVVASRRRGTPIVLEVRDLWPQMPIAMGALRNPASIKAARQLERFAYRHASRIVALSPGMEAGIVASGYPAERVTVIPNCCDFDMFDVGPEPGRQLRGRYEWLGERPLVVYTGTLGLMNGVDYLAHLASAVQRRCPDVRFVIAGSGKDEPKVRETAARLGVLDRTLFMLGNIPKTDVPALTSAADIATSFIVDVREGWCNSANKFFDALAAGKPIAINYGGWQADLITATGCGLLLDVHDVEASADRLVAALHDPAWLAEAGAAGQRLGREHFDRDQLASLLDHVLREAVA